MALEASRALPYDVTNGRVRQLDAAGAALPMLAVAALVASPIEAAAYDAALRTTFIKIFDIRPDVTVSLSRPAAG